LLLAGFWQSGYNSAMDNFWQKIKKPIIGLAPMDGVTDEPMRQIQVSIAKPAVLYTEFISAEGFIRQPQAFEKTLSFQENERPIVIQIFGYTPEAFYETILKVAQMNFDGIDINMGCPARKVLGKGGGGALIGNCRLAGKIIEKSLKAIEKTKTKLPLSVKTRIGQKEIITQDWIGFLSEYPLSEITLHGRLLKQGVSGPVNWEEIKLAAEICHHKGIICLGNGGIKSAKEGREMAEKYGLDGVLIGQAALGNPWIFKEDYQPTKEDILKTILKHAKLATEFYPPERFVTVYKHFGWYPRGFKNSKRLKVELLKTKNLDEVLEVIAHFR
jgi:nifR3 family TIM-barrel protein